MALAHTMAIERRERAGQTPLPGDGYQIGQRLGRYEIVGHLGAGGMAEVLLARLVGSGGFEKLLAIKVLRRSLAANAQFVEMFFHEARLGAQLNHPNVGQVLELSQAQGTYFMVMELLDGVTLADIFETVESGADTEGGRSALEPRIACNLVMQACEGLHHVHEAVDSRGLPMSIVHLDVSPQNLFLTVAGTVKLIDFGIARSAALAPAASPSPFRGKFAYASPEQLDGAEPDRRSDVFSLGTVLWEMLAGQRLFKGENPLESFFLVSEAPIPRLRERCRVPAALDAVVAKALSRNPADRQATAFELYSELRRAAADLGPHVVSYEVADLVAELFAVPDPEQASRAA